ncbi:unnamed protein product [Paramecium pentaurelia]|uniref:Uncharacterized protein n=1 Tax=Paramecium pentaurelia TaxID=43138 RepID=A0A8S1T4Z9_9CILI|nr:unnamed protein product [Paramecium pentaurelia]
MGKKFHPLTKNIKIFLLNLKHHFFRTILNQSLIIHILLYLHLQYWKHKVLLSYKENLQTIKEKI